MAAPKVFLSHCVEDGGVARRLYDDLRGLGADVFQFEESSKPGEAFARRIAKNIQECDWFVVLLSEPALRSTWVEYETLVAITARNERREGDPHPNLVPLAVGSVDSPPELTPFNRLPFEEYDAGLEKLRVHLGLGEVAEEESGLSEGPAASLSIKLTGAPRKGTTGLPIRWTATLRNDGEAALEEVVARLGNELMGEPFRLASGEKRELSRITTYTAPGRRSRTLAVKASTAGGRAVEERTRASVLVREGEAATAREESRAAADHTRLRLKRILQDVAPDAKDVSSVVPRVGTDSEAGEVLLSSLFAIWAFVLVVGLGVGAFLLADWLVELLREATWIPDWGRKALEFVAGWCERWGWISWTTLVVVTLLAWGLAFVVYDDACPVDTGEYFGVALGSNLGIVLLTVVPATLLLGAVSPDVQFWFFVAAFGPPAVIGAGAAALDAFE